MYYFHLYQWHLKNDQICASLDWIAGNKILAGLDEWSLTQSVRNLLQFPTSSSPRPYFVCACGDSACDTISFALERNEAEVILRQLQRRGFPTVKEVRIARNKFDYAVAQAVGQLREFEQTLCKISEGSAFPDLPSMKAPPPFPEPEFPDKFSSLADLLSFLRHYPWKAEELTTELHSLNPARRFLALRLLLFLGEPVSLPYAYTQILDDNIYIRIAAAHLLKHLHFFSQPAMKEVFFVLQSRKQCRRKQRERGLAYFFSHPFYLGLQALPELTPEERRILLKVMRDFPLPLQHSYMEEIKQLVYQPRLSDTDRSALLNMLPYPAAFPFVEEIMKHSSFGLELRKMLLHKLQDGSMLQSLTLSSKDPLLPFLKALQRRKTTQSALYLALSTSSLLALFYLLYTLWQKGHR